MMPNAPRRKDSVVIISGDVDVAGVCAVPLLITDGDVLCFIEGDVPVIDCADMMKHFFSRRVNCDAKPQPSPPPPPLTQEP